MAGIAVFIRQVRVGMDDSDTVDDMGVCKKGNGTGITDKDDRKDNLQNCFKLSIQHQTIFLRFATKIIVIPIRLPYKTKKGNIS
ncbi:MAG TPA: hypothetical protein DIT04_10085 [Dysgonomonas sp.]|nr:hypothetical protein [Dysgonomonas sp.]